MKKIDVLIVDDSAYIRKLVTDFLSSSPYIHVIGTARNGEDAIKKIRQLQPHVVTMDVEMPILNGLDALKIIMKENPLPVIILSATTKEGTENALLALQNGAVDVIAKPSQPINDLDKVRDEWIEKVLVASKANMKQAIIQSIAVNKTINLHEKYSKIEPKDLSLSFNWNQLTKKIILIGTSTGGPGALQTVLAKIPKDIAAPILIVQHMPSGFTKSLAKRLNSLSEITVKEAENGEILQKGTAYIAPGGSHLKVKTLGERLTVQLDDTIRNSIHCPSVDVLFESAASLTGYGKIAVIMTGMGSDGAKGLNLLKNNGQVKAIAESKETCIVFGMPKAAIATNLIDDIEDVDKIAETILKYV